MKRQLAILAFLMVAAISAIASDKHGKGIKLLEGYTVRGDYRTIDANGWSIERKGGVTIEYECGPNEG